MCRLALGQTTYTEMSAPGANLVNELGFGSDGQLWLSNLVGKSGTSQMFTTSGNNTLAPVINLSGFPLPKSADSFGDFGSNDRTTNYLHKNVGSPQGPLNLFGELVNGQIVILQSSGKNVKILCSNYTVDGGKGSLPRRLLSGPFPSSIDSSYYIVGTTITASNGVISGTASTLFSLGTVTGTTCDLHTVFTLNQEIVQVAKQSDGSFLAELTVIATPNASVTKVGALDSKGSTFTNLIGTSGTQTQALRCCEMAPDWANGNVAVSYTGKDSKNHAVTDINGVINEFYNSGVTSELTADIWIDDFRANFAVLGGSNNSIGIGNLLVAVNTTTKASWTVSDSYNNFISGAVSPLVPKYNAAVSNDGIVYLDTLKVSDQTAHLYKTTIVPGFTLIPEPSIVFFATDNTQITAGGVSGLAWSTTNATSVAIDQGIGQVPTSGTLVVSPTQTTTYTLTATGPGGIASATVTVNVTPKVVLPSITSGGISNAASGDPNLSPGVYASIYGQNLSDVTAQAQTLPLPPILGGVQVLLNGVPVPMFYVSPNQINFQVPYDITLGQGVVQVIRNGVAGNSPTATFLTTSPGVFQTPKDGSGIITDSLRNVITTSNPVSPGSVYTVWLTGLGKTTCDNLPAGVAPNAICPAIVQPTVTIGSQTAQVLFAGLSYDFPGLYQINFQLSGQVNAPTSSNLVQCTITTPDMTARFKTLLLQGSSQ